MPQPARSILANAVGGRKAVFVFFILFFYESGRSICLSESGVLNICHGEQVAHHSFFLSKSTRHRRQLMHFPKTRSMLLEGKFFQCGSACSRFHFLSSTDCQCVPSRVHVARIFCLFPQWPCHRHAGSLFHSSTSAWKLASFSHHGSCCCFELNSIQISVARKVF